jgi:hypothetical protein
MKTSRFMICAALAVVLAGCGGGGDADMPVAEDDTARVPSSATASVQAFVGFVGRQAPSDQAEPLSLLGATPPTSETEEPVDL